MLSQSEMLDILGVSKGDLEEVSQKWGIARLELFGSALTDKFDSQSDIDLLITFTDGVGPDLFDFVELKDDLQALVKRSVDLVDREVIEKSKNPYRKEGILSSTRVLYDRAA